MSIVNAINFLAKNKNNSTIINAIKTASVQDAVKLANTEGFQFNESELIFVADFIQAISSDERLVTLDGARWESLNYLEEVASSFTDDAQVFLVAKTHCCPSKRSCCPDSVKTPHILAENLWKDFLLNQRRLNIPEPPSFSSDERDNTQLEEQQLIEEKWNEYRETIINLWINTQSSDEV